MKFLLQLFTTIGLAGNALVFLLQHGDYLSGLISAFLAGANAYAAGESLFKGCV